jgi:two-component system, sensor histidine kinase and response regulator
MARAVISATPLTIRSLERIPILASIIALAVAGIVLIGWLLRAPLLVQMLPWADPTVPHVAVGLAIGGVALMCVRSARRELRIVGVAGAAILVAIALLMFTVDALPGGRAIERAFFTGGHAPGHLQIPVNTAVSLLFVAGGLAALAIPRFADSRVPQFFGAVALLIAFVAFVGYAFGFVGLYQPGRSLGMTPWTVVAIHALAVGVIFARKTVGFPALLSDPGAGGRLARRLLPAAIAIPFAVAWIVAQGERAGYYSGVIGDSLFTVLTVVALVWIVSRSARVVQRTDLARAQLLAREAHEREVAQQALIAAETASSAKSDFLAVMSHELRTPLTAIIGYEELLADGITGPVNTQQVQQLSRIKSSAQHLLGLIDEILTFSRLEAGRETVHLEVIDVNRAIETSTELVAPLAAEKKLGFAVYPLDPPRTMRTDSGKLRQIVVNLLANAVKFTSRGGITLTTSVDGSDLVLAVCDTGVGITAEHQERCFEAFWQAEQKATRRATGTGLGLTVTRRLARLMGGDVTLESATGHGTTFTVRLPGVQPPTTQPVAAMSAAAHQRA